MTELRVLPYLLIDAALLLPNGEASRAQDQVTDAHRLLLLDVGNVAHHDVHERVLHQGQKDEHSAPRHKYVNGLQLYREGPSVTLTGCGLPVWITDLDVGDWGQGLLTVGMLGGQGEEAGHTEGDASGDGLGLDPK